MSELVNRPQTMVDIYRLLPEGTPIQVIDNEFYMSPAPNFSHFDVVDRIVDELKKIVARKNSGRVIFAPVAVFLGDKNAVQPDIFFISTENANIIREEGIFGAPDLIIEVLSKGNANADLVKKKAIYEAFGIKEYFIVDPDNKSVITYFFDNHTYVEQTTQQGRLISRVLGEDIGF